MRKVMYSLLALALLALLAVACAQPAPTPSPTTPKPAPAPSPTATPAPAPSPKPTTAPPTASAPVKAQVIRVSDLYALTHSGGRVWIQPFMAEVEKRSGGRIKFDYFANDTLVKSQDALDAVRKGTSDMANMIYAGNVVPTQNVVQLPSSFADDKLSQASLAFRDIVFDQAGAIWQPFSKNGVQPVIAYTVSNYQLHTTKKAVRTPDDLKGLKIRTAGITMTWSLELLGAVPVSMAIGDAYTAFERGVLDGMAQSIPPLKDWGYYVLIKYSTINADLGGYPVIYAMNSNTWSSLPDDVKKIFLDVGKEISESGSVKYLADMANDLATWKKEGRIEIINLSPADYKLMKDKNAAVWDKFAQDMESKGFAGKDLVAKWKAALKAHGIE